jgi:nitrite reductase/ring-hydroxylating ferredoxin subunit
VRFFPLEKLINLHDGYIRQFKIDSLQLLLVQRQGELYLFESHCPHRHHPLENATIGNGIIQCALHQYQFAIEDGRLLRATEAPGPEMVAIRVQHRHDDVRRSGTGEGAPSEVDGAPEAS